MAEESFAEADLSGPLADTSHLARQDLATLDVSTLHALSAEVMSRQATINIGTIGHVAHGKSTLVKAISGVQTVRFRKELERNITIKLGYANAKLYKCAQAARLGAHPLGAPTTRARGRSATPPMGAATRTRPRCVRARTARCVLTRQCTRDGCGGTMALQRHVSFVDCPGHDILMATMLNGAAVMDAALLLVAGNGAPPRVRASLSVQSRARNRRRPSTWRPLTL